MGSNPVRRAILQRNGSFMTTKHMTPPPETFAVSYKERIYCDGDGGALGHPGVYLTIPTNMEWVECPYCDRRFVYEPEED